MAKMASDKSALAGETKTKKPWVEDVKISPDNSLIAYGTHGGLSKLEVCRLQGPDGSKMSKAGAFNLGISSALIHLDWSLDSSSVVINSQGYELMWYDINGKTKINASSAKDIDFHTWTCTLGFPVQGIWPGVDYTDVNTVCRSHSRQILASGEDSGSVKLFKWPCAVESAAANEFRGHSSHVCRVKFTANDKYLVSVGGNDKTLFFWETDFCMDDPDSNANRQPEEDHDEADIHPDDEFVTNRIDRAKTLKQAAKAEAKAQRAPPKREAQMDADADDMFAMEDVGDGDEFMAVKPWIGQMKEPKGFKKPPKGASDAPNIELELEWVHGYRAHDCKNNLAYTADGGIAYHAAGLGIVYDHGEHQQRFFNNHIDDITAIAFSPDGKTIATGEVGPKCSIYIWDAITMQKIH